MKVNKENAGWIFLTCVLAILFGLSIYLGISGWYFKTEKSYSTDLQLGKTVQFGVKKNEANSISFNLDGAFLSGERLPQIISIKNLDDEENLRLRVKVFVCSGDNQTKEVGIVETSNWQYEEDGYYYLNQTITPQNKVALCTYIFIDESAELQTNTKYIVTFLVESLDSNQDINKIWNYNPVQNV